jgi:hypothetical protein
MLLPNADPGSLKTVKRNLRIVLLSMLCNFTGKKYLIQNLKVCLYYVHILLNITELREAIHYFVIKLT